VQQQVSCVSLPFDFNYYVSVAGVREQFTTSLTPAGKKKKGQPGHWLGPVTGMGRWVQPSLKQEK
jgi:hypothetical protein